MASRKIVRDVASMTGVPVMPSGLSGLPQVPGAPAPSRPERDVPARRAGEPGGRIERVDVVLRRRDQDQIRAAVGARQIKSLRIGRAHQRLLPKVVSTCIVPAAPR